MEIEYTNFDLNSDIYGKNEIIGLIDRNSHFKENSFYDIRKFTYNKNISVNLFLKFGDSYKRRKLIPKIINDLEIEENLLKRKMGTLSTGELIKFLVIRVCLSNCKTVILEHIDTFMTPRDFKNLLKILKNYNHQFQKNIIVSTNKVENIIQSCDRFVVAENSILIYSGKQLRSMPEKTDAMKFVDLANEKGANMSYYKDRSDLLKAIYRSVKR